MSKSILNYNEPIIFDLETSGLEFNAHEIIQIGAYCPHNGRTFEAKVQFDIKKADPKALEMNHYDENKWWNALTQKQAMHGFAKFCQENSSLKKKSAKGAIYYVACLMGFNCNAFDRFFINKLFDTYKQFAPYDYRMLDVFELAKWLLPGLREYNLTALSEYFSITTVDAHDAVFDCLMTAKVGACLMEILAESKTYKMPKWASDLLDDLDYLQSEDDIPF